MRWWRLWPISKSATVKKRAFNAEGAENLFIPEGLQWSQRKAKRVIEPNFSMTMSKHSTFCMLSFAFSAPSRLCVKKIILGIGEYSDV